MMNKIKNWIIGFLKQGISPEKLALAVAFGITLGIFPMLGTTSLLCLGASLLFRLNLPAIQAVNYVIYPLQLILFIPFFKIGTSLFSSASFDYTLSDITSMLASDMLKTISDLFIMNLYAILLWLIMSPFLFGLIYIVCVKLFHLLQKVGKGAMVPDQDRGNITHR